MLSYCLASAGALLPYPWVPSITVSSPVPPGCCQAFGHEPLRQPAPLVSVFRQQSSTRLCGRIKCCQAACGELRTSDLHSLSKSTDLNNASRLASGVRPCRTCRMHRQMRCRPTHSPRALVGLSHARTCAVCIRFQNLSLAQVMKLHSGTRSSPPCGWMTARLCKRWRTPGICTFRVRRWSGRRQHLHHHIRDAGPRTPDAFPASTKEARSSPAGRRYSRDRRRALGGAEKLCSKPSSHDRLFTPPEPDRSLSDFMILARVGQGMDGPVPRSSTRQQGEWIKIVGFGEQP
ncbi:hypothetical protein [Azospirillum melinis]